MKQNDFQNVFNSDLYRYYGIKGENRLKKIFRPLEIKYLFYLRKCQSAKNKVSKLYYKLMLRKISIKTHIQIYPETKIGRGFYIGHFGKIIINPSAILGNNINIATGVVIGQENRGKRKGTPIIGNDCWIGSNAVIVGNIKVGNDVLIAPLSYVNFNVPDHSIVIGNPAKIIFKDGATKDYINNKV